MQNVSFISVLAFLIGCGGGETNVSSGISATTKPVTKAPPPEPKPFDAEQTFNMTCATCHGVDGKGDGPAAAALDPKPANFGSPEFWETRDRDHIVKVVTEGGAAVGKSPLMASFAGQFDAEEIEALAIHVEGFASNTNDAGKAKAGKSEGEGAQ